MPRYDYARCRECNRPRSETGLLSCTRLCTDCAKALLAENVDGLHTKTGMPWQRWRQAMAACVGAQLPEASIDATQRGL